jgi:hypothetical protein
LQITNCLAKLDVSRTWHCASFIPYVILLPYPQEFNNLMHSLLALLPFSNYGNYSPLNSSSSVHPGTRVNEPRA